MSKFFYALLCTAAAGCSSAQAASLFDFESTNTTSGGALTSLNQTVDGLTLDLTRPGSSFDIADLSSSSGPPSFGSRTISPFVDTGPTPMNANFSEGLSSVSIQAGDYDADSDLITLNAYSGLNGTGTLLGTQTVNYGFGTFPGDVATLSISSSVPILSATFIGGSSAFPNSVFYDNISATVESVSTVPLPASAPMFGVALITLGAIGYGTRRGAKAASAT